MNSNNSSLLRNKELVMGLSHLYEAFGYKKFKMRKFEQYDLYLNNKSFLRNTNIITVTDPAGRLLALKPDITLSIVKNVRAASLPQKLYYNENIYIADSSAGEIKETTQVGLEYVGDLDIRSMGEILLLAAESLSQADENYRIAVSHMGILSDIVDSANINDSAKERIYEYISQKNLHGIKDISLSLGLSDSISKRLCGLVITSGSLKDSIESAEFLVCGNASKEALNELKALSDIIDKFNLSDKFILDFTVMNDIKYYNGLVFQGFISGIPKTVLSGGRYDNLVHNFGCETSAAGFAVMTDLLREYIAREPDYDCDVLLLYSANSEPIKVLGIQKEINNGGESCIALTDEPEWIKYKRKVILSSDGSLKNE